jgi:hypothetical protein
MRGHEAETAIMRQNERFQIMGKRVAVLLGAAVLSLALVAPVAAATSAHVRIDPTTLTPPLKPFRVCYQDGPWVKCDTSGPTEIDVNQPMDDFDLPCGTIYVNATVTSHATRWYQNLLLVERDGQHHIKGSFTLSPTGSGPSVAFASDLSSRETFLVPGDLSSDSEVSHGTDIRIPALGADFHASGITMADGTQHGRNSFTDAAKAQLCDLLTP